MIKPVIAYGYREPANAFLPRDVLDALGRPPHVKQGSLVVFAHTATDAWRRLGQLDMASTSSRKLAPLWGPRIKALIDASLDYRHSVYAMPGVGGDVVEITAPGGVRVVAHIGRIDCGKFVSNHHESSDHAEPEVTDAMVYAAFGGLEGNGGYECDVPMEAMRAAIAAALKVRTES